ncbi:AraC family transcriptional regulator [Flagellimonas pacifica]|uniref:AraC-type DNA-binding protein n=1 Tax=Flagellimonas pacifica TaxID=1247520 RepID=A0A285MYY8_9FLAO|nr:AraC family transcriptional regulator [Allomuricauda parva]SNZ01747.1 AraC-type DNA-binding protein [Allomuricauda parva]
MIPIYRKITHPSFLSYSSSIEAPPEFHTPWHYHPEFELILILNSKGTRFMGDNISNFDNVELVLIGPNLPHFWKKEGPIEKDAIAYVIHFSEDFLGNTIFDLPEGMRIKKLLNNARFGISFTENKNSKIVNKIRHLIESKNFKRILTLLTILDLLSKKRNYKTLSSEGFVDLFNKKNSQKINSTIEYAMNNFKEKINLDEIASSVSMSKSSFCRFFKKSTGKTYFDFLREVRIGYACKLILENNLSITQIAYECGYGNISNFNRQFKDTVNMVPKEYKRKLLRSNVSL